MSAAQQFFLAKRIVAERQKTESAADLTVLKKHLQKKWEDAEAHARQWHSKGCCWYGQDAGREHNRFSTYWEMHMISEGEPDESVLAGLPADVAAALRNLVFLPEEERNRFIEEARGELEAARRAEGKAFARQRHAELVMLGFSPKRASTIMRAAGPGRSLEAVEWAYQTLEAIGNTDALDCLLGNPGGTNGFGKGRMESALRAIGIEPPSASSSGALFAILRGAHAALIAGLPARETVSEKTI